MRYDKSKLISITKKYNAKTGLTPDEIKYLLTFEKTSHESSVIKFLKLIAVPASLAFGFLFTTFPDYFNDLVKHMPSWTNLSPQLLTGVDYLWDLIGEPIKKANIIYHIPNIVLYSFGIVGVKKIIDSIDRRTWLDKVFAVQTLVKKDIADGRILLKMKKGHSLLFVGNGDFIGMQFTLNHKSSEAVTISSSKPDYALIWNNYDVDTLYDDLKNVITKSDGEHAGEYIFFPVKDDQIFLPGEKAYDLSPHKLDILCQNIRVIEKELKWKSKRIIIIGDRFHKSFVQSEDQKGVIKNSGDTITLESVAKKYSNTTLLDPSDIVISEIIKIAKGRKVVFRATKEGIAEYKKRFYERLDLLGYKQSKTKKGILTIGYDLFEDQTEQQTLAHRLNDYYPVVLSKNVRDALIRNGYKSEEFLYVPDLVLKTLSITAEEQ